MAKWTTAEQVRDGSSICPNATGMMKERIAQSKRTRAGSVVMVDWPQVARTCLLLAIFLFFCGSSASKPSEISPSQREKCHFGLKDKKSSWH